MDSSWFFKSTWHLIGPMVSVAIQKYFTTGQMPKFISATKLVVLSKVNHPQTASDFRTISCCNVIYKCISKLLCQRIKEVLPSLINKCQGAFVKEREILYNVRICQDIARGYQRLDASSRLTYRKPLTPSIGISFEGNAHCLKIPHTVYQMGYGLCHLSEFHHLHQWSRLWGLWRRERAQARWLSLTTPICYLYGIPFKANEGGQS